MSDLSAVLRRSVPEDALLLPSSPSYETARLIYNRMHDARPAALVRTLDPQVLSAVIDLAAISGVPLALRGGGHHIGGFSTVNGGIVLDFSQFREVCYDRATGLARVSPGARLADVDRALAAHGRCIPAGTVSQTGIAGLTLGGGIGWLVAGYGLSCDHLVSARVLLADGQSILASALEHPELFSALRGGGAGAFGVVLELRFATLPLPRTRAGSVWFPLAKAAHVLTTLQELLQTSTPDTVTLAPCLTVRDGEPGLSVDLCCHSEDERGLDHIRQAIGGDFSGVIDRPYLQWQSAFDAAFLPPQRGYWKSIQFDHLELGPELLLEALSTAPSQQCSVLIEYYNTDTLAAYAEGSSYPLRTSRMGVLLSARWPGCDGDEGHIRWSRSHADTLRKAGGAKAYSNYSQANDLRPSATYPPETLALMRELERCYDPNRIFAQGHRSAITPFAPAGSD